MKLTPSLLLLTLVAALPLRATVVISPSLFGNSSTMPGSSADFTFFGNPVQFPVTGPDISANYVSGTPSQPTLLSDFTAAVGTDAEYTYGAQAGTNPAYGTITSPLGTSVKTGILYAVGSTGTPELAPNLVRFTLGSTPSFDYSDFNVYVMISNAPTSGIADSQLFASVYDPTGAVVLAAVSPLVLDDGTTTNTATFEEFHITGAVSGDILQLGAGALSTVSVSGLPAQNTAYLSGVSFQTASAAPEPSTNAMIIGALAVLGLGLRQGRKLAGSNA